VGPAEFSESTAFFEELGKFSSSGVRLRPREYFSAVALTKRFAYPVRLAGALGLHRHRPFPDTAVIAARLWLARSDLLEAITDYGNGQCLHWRSPDQGAKDGEDTVPDQVWSGIVSARKISPPPAYLAVLVMDADHMGKWLRGDMSPSLETALHPSMREYFVRLGAGGHLKAKRPVSPALHAAISEALTNFATRIAPTIVTLHQGELIYAGGDDLLALLPTETAIVCASALEGAFRGVGSPGGAPEGYWREHTEEIGDRLVMGPHATISAGIAVVHHKEDLRAALALARNAESAAKQERNRLHLFIARRSGERVGESLGWSECSTMSEAVEKFAAGASDRWLYRLRALMPALPEEAFDLELKRQLGRSDPETRMSLESFVERNAFHAQGRSPDEVVRLWQAAAFLARGRDEGGEDG
jgi:CRISPR-associated protein Cmr2